MKSVLIHSGLSWTTEQKEEWIAKDEKALDTIVLSVKASQLSYTDLLKLGTN